MSPTTHLVPDVSSLYSVAAQLQARAQSVRDGARALESRAASADWTSVAAASFRRAAASAGGDLVAAAGRLDDAAAALTALAWSVQSAGGCP